jgi:hypothetical protein
MPPGRRPNNKPLFLMVAAAAAASSSVVVAAAFITSSLCQCIAGNSALRPTIIIRMLYQCRPGRQLPQPWRIFTATTDVLPDLACSSLLLHTQYTSCNRFMLAAHTDHWVNTDTGIARTAGCWLQVLMPTAVRHYSNLLC